MKHTGQDAGSDGGLVRAVAWTRMSPSSSLSTSSGQSSSPSELRAIPYVLRGAGSVSPTVFSPLRTASASARTPTRATKSFSTAIPGMAPWRYGCRVTYIAWMTWSSATESPSHSSSFSDNAMYTSLTGISALAA